MRYALKQAPLKTKKARMNAKAISLVLCIVLIPARNTGAHQQAAEKKEVSVRLSKAQVMSFQAALTELSRQGHVAIIAEGVPLKPQLKGTKTAGKSDAEPGIPRIEKLSLSNAVAQIADTYDYDVAQQTPLFVLKKRYTDPRDLPDVTMKECQQTLANALRIVDAFSPHYPYIPNHDNQRDLSLQFAGTLSAAQEQAMQNGTLHVGDLTPPQQSLIRTIALYIYIQYPLVYIAPTLDVIQHSSSMNLTVKQETFKNNQQTPPDLLVTEPKSGKELLALTRTTMSSAARPPLPPKPEPQTDDSPRSTTLGRVAAGMTVEGKPIDVDAALQDKTVMVFGLSNTSPLETLRALAFVYGLHIGSSDQGGLRLALRGSSIPNRVQEMPAALWATVPEAYTRAAHAGEVVPSNALRVAKTPEEYQNQQRKNEENTRRRWQNMNRPAITQMEAGQRLMVLLQLRLKAVGSDHLPISALKSEESKLLAVAMMGTALSTLSNSYAAQYSGPVSACLDHFDQIVISGKPYPNPTVKGQMNHSLSLTGTDPKTGEIVGMGGFG